MTSFLFGKHSKPDPEDPPAKRQTVELVGSQEEKFTGDDNDIEVEVALDTPVEVRDETSSTIDKDDLKKEIKYALIDALKDPEAAKLLSEQIVNRMQKKLKCLSMTRYG